MKIHIVQSNESLPQIAERYGVDLDPLVKANPDMNAEMVLEVGQKIKVPTNGVKVVKNQSTPLPKWWYEEEEYRGLLQNAADAAAEVGSPLQELPQHPTSYPMNYPTPYTAAPPAYGQYGAGSYDPYSFYAHIPAQPIGYTYGPSPSPWYDPAMMIFATNRIPIPPRMVNINGVRSFKLPTSFFQLDDWDEEWEEENTN